MRKVSEEAEKMNEANQFISSAMEQVKRSQMEKKVEEEMKIPIDVSKGSLLDEIQALKIYDPVSLPKKARRTIEAHKGDVNSLAFSVTGTVLATGGYDSTVKLWDAKSGSARATLMGHVQSVMSVDISPNDEMVLGAGNDNTVRIWTVQQARSRHALTGHTGKVFTARFSSDSQRVVSGSHDRSLKVWDLMKGYCIRTIFCFSSVNDLCLDFDGRLICSGHFDAHVRLWDVKTGECASDLAELHVGQVTSVSISPDGTKILSNSRDNTLKIVDIRTYEVLNRFSNENYRSGVNWNGACWSPDGSYVIAGGIDGTIFIWDVSTEKLAVSLKGTSNNIVNGCAWSLAGGSLASCDKGGVVTIWGN